VSRGLRTGTARRPVTALRNLGPVSARRLAAVGIATERDLAAIGAVEAYLRVLDHHPHGTSLNRCGRSTARSTDLDWRDSRSTTGARLRSQVQRHDDGDGY
jgi:hypothetical protein